MEMNCTEYFKVKYATGTGGTKKIYLAKDWDSSAFRNFLEQLDAEIEHGRYIHNKRNALVHFDQNERAGIKDEIVVKRFGLSRKYDRMRFFFLKSKAFRSFFTALIFQKNQLKTPRPIAFIEERGWLHNLIQCYYVTEFVKCDCSFSEILKVEDHGLRTKVLQKLAVNIRLMHDSGIIHRDMHASNILIKNLETDPEFYFIDLNRARKRNALSLKARAKDFNRLTLTEKDQTIFYKNYEPSFFIKIMTYVQKAQIKHRKMVQLKNQLRNFKKSLRIPFLKT